MQCLQFLFNPANLPQHDSQPTAGACQLGGLHEGVMCAQDYSIRQRYRCHALTALIAIVYNNRSLLTAALSRWFVDGKTTSVQLLAQLIMVCVKWSQLFNDAIQRLSAHAVYDVLCKPKANHCPE